jgi:hypothetical protein
MTGIASRQGCLAGSGDAGDLDIADLDRPADLPLPGGECVRGFRCSAVEWRQAEAEGVVDSAIEGLYDAITRAARRQQRQAETDFEDRNRRRPNDHHNNP